MLLAILPYQQWLLKLSRTLQRITTHPNNDLLEGHGSIFLLFEKAKDLCDRKQQYCLTSNGIFNNAKYYSQNKAIVVLEATATEPETFSGQR